ncbi:hypothetical protein ASE14_07570 [Agromyces sp. Root81]|uniref:hypothetical protein n=1 Tax=Agromyces sp. Root81 TaxID=1736601 RepID=UPI0006F52DF8|nr:hypothetical protein [Agromyces sp. Root81]KRC60821.1 hypothetical protein ASE14_07570 [Agromyces sp. Root81]
MASLREELTGERTARVSYSLLCPPGWTKLPPAALVGNDAAAPAIAAMKSAGRPDLVLQFRTMLSTLKSALRERGVFEVYLAPEREPGAPMPAMLAVSPFVIPDGVSWDTAVSRLAKSAPVEVPPADVDMRLIRRRSELRDESALIITDELIYLVPVPGGDGRKALLFQYTVLSVDDPDSTELAKGLVFIGEAIMSTFTWVPAA